MAIAMAFRMRLEQTWLKALVHCKSTDFVVDLPEEFKNVTSLTVVSVQIPNSCYNFTSNLKTNEFTVETFDISNNNVSIA